MSPYDYNNNPFKWNGHDGLPRNNDGVYLTENIFMILFVINISEGAVICSVIQVHKKYDTKVDLLQGLTGL